MHGAGDHYVPARFSEQLFDAAPEPKRLLLVSGATHNDSMRVGSAAYIEALRELFGVELSAGAPTARRTPLTAALAPRS